jgi:beta-galactosidase
MPAVIRMIIRSPTGKQVAEQHRSATLVPNSTTICGVNCSVQGTELWSVEQPNLYSAETLVLVDDKVLDRYVTPFGIRSFTFDPDKGFSLNGQRMKINGVCMHHDLGCLGAAINRRALERQLEILKRMGVNAIRTSHNPPAPELLDLCDRMGFLVMDEAFDMWKKAKTKYDYSNEWDDWHRRDLEDMVKRDRNHPSIILWSIGNEVNELWDKKDPSGEIIASELATTIRSLDATRPVTAACNNQDPDNPVLRSGALDIVGYNYAHKDFAAFHTKFPGMKFLATETVSSLASRGVYDMPSDSIRRWPSYWDRPFTNGNTDLTCSAYDNVSAPWGSTQEETWKIIKKHDHLSGQFIWTGFDYLGEPTPYDWPARSSYFGIVDLAGFPKDTYYMYQSEWTTTPVLHVFPHWNWKEGQTIDVWAYSNCEEVELFLNGKSQGVKKKSDDELHFFWRLTYHPGELKAEGRMRGRTVMTQVTRTAGKPSAIILEPDRNRIAADGEDLSFVTVKIVDEKGTIVPGANNLVHFEISGEGTIAGVDNGLQTSLEPFKADSRSAFNGLCMAVVKAGVLPGKTTIRASSEGLKTAQAQIECSK